MDSLQQTNVNIHYYEPSELSIAVDKKKIEGKGSERGTWTEHQDGLAERFFFFLSSSCLTAKNSHRVGPFKDILDSTHKGYCVNSRVGLNRGKRAIFKAQL